jgi:hypothetical protein
LAKREHIVQLNKILENERAVLRERETALKKKNHEMVEKMNLLLNENVRLGFEARKT